MLNLKLFIQPYPSKKEFESEANRDDVGSYPAIHVEFYHPKLSVIEYFTSLKFSLQTAQNRVCMKFARFGDVEHGTLNLDASDVYIYSHTKGKTITDNLWIYRDLDFWIGYHQEFLRDDYDFWSLTLKELSKLRPVDPRLADLCAGIRVEFHD